MMDIIVTEPEGNGQTVYMRRLFIIGASPANEGILIRGIDFLFAGELH